MSPGELDWDALPHDAERFFELDEGYSRRDLKKQYARLIKKFKPETHPEEFRRIRSAYESLERKIRFGDNWEPANDVNGHPESEPSSSTLSVGALDRLEAGSTPEGLYYELTNETLTTSRRYLELALLSDLLPNAEPSQFLRHLMAGLQAHPNSSILRPILERYLDVKHVGTTVEFALQFMASTEQHGQFYYLTERLWIQYLEGTSFPEFRQLLELCEQVRPRVDEIAARLIFTHHVLTKAFFRAEEQWRRNKLALLSENYELLPPELADELDFLGNLSSYLKERDAWPDDHDPLIDEIDRTIRTYCEQSERNGDAAVIRLQLVLESDPEAVVTAFDYLDRRYTKLTSVLDWITFHVADRNFESGTLGSKESRARSVSQFCGNLCHLTEYRGGRTSTLVEWANVSFMLFGCSLPVLVGLSFASLDLPSLVTGAIVVLSLVGYFVFLRRWWLRRIIRPFYLRPINKKYEEIWRPALLRYLRETGYPIEDVLEELEQIETPSDPEQKLLDLARADSALAITAIALRVRAGY